MSVSYACHKCSGTIEEGTAFCPHCGAPQIRVAMPEPKSPSFSPGTPAEMQPPAEPVPLSSLSFPEDAGLNWRLALRPILLGGLSILLGSMLPLGVFWNILVIAGGGAFAVALYHRRSLARTSLTAVLGAKIGSAAALFSYGVSALMLVLGCVIDSADIRHVFIARLQEMQGQLPDPQSREMLQTILQKLNTPEGFAALITAGLAISFVVFLAFGAIGGAIGGSLMSRNQQRR